MERVCGCGGRPVNRLLGKRFIRSPFMADARTSSCRRIWPNLTVNPTAYALSVSASSYAARWTFYDA